MRWVLGRLYIRFSTRHQPTLVAERYLKGPSHAPHLLASYTLLAYKQAHARRLHQCRHDSAFQGVPSVGIGALEETQHRQLESCVAAGGLQQGTP